MTETKGKKVLLEGGPKAGGIWTVSLEVVRLNIPDVTRYTTETYMEEGGMLAMRLGIPINEGPTHVYEFDRVEGDHEVFTFRQSEPSW